MVAWEDVLDRVFKRLLNRKDSLLALEDWLGPRKPTIGIEAWFKVEVIVALDRSVEHICGKGADLVLKTGERIELKAATDFNPEHIVHTGARKQLAPCLFLGNGQRPWDVSKFEKYGVNLVDHRPLNFIDNNKWLVGLIKPVITFYRAPKCPRCCRGAGYSISLKEHRFLSTARCGFITGIGCSGGMTTML